MAVATSAAMASTSAIGSNQLAASKNGVFSTTKALIAPSMAAPLNKKRAAAVAMSGAPAYVPDMAKRNTVNLLLLGAIGLPTASLAGGYAWFFYPPGGGGGGGGITAKDALGNDVIASAWLETHPVGDRTLTQGLKGDPTYLVVEGESGVGSLATYGINAVCTHLGCVVPWNAAENKFACPCHGSQYNNQGKVIRGPAPLSLALAHADLVDDRVIFSTWTETDFRTGDAPWWS